MIKNVVFDLGQVLIEFEPFKYLKKFGFSESYEKKIYEATFANEIWPELDRGTYTMEQAVELYCKNNPELEHDIKKVLSDDWVEMLVEKTETSEYLKQLKQEGFKVFALTNFHREAFEFVENKYDFFKILDGIIVSSHENVLKPEPRIYELLLGKYNLVPEETVFIDDVKKNTDAAEKLGIKGIVFTNIDDLKKDLTELLAN